MSMEIDWSTVQATVTSEQRGSEWFSRATATAVVSSSGIDYVQQGQHEIESQAWSSGSRKRAERVAIRHLKQALSRKKQAIDTRETRAVELAS